MGKSTAKGTRYENHVLSKLREVWPEAERSPKKGVDDYGDFVGVPLLVEAKWRKTSRSWRIAKWVETAMLKRVRAKEDPKRGWAIALAEDKRSGIPIDLVVVPLDDWLELRGECE